MNKQEVITNTMAFVKKQLEDAEGGHDWFHMLRVLNNAKRIGMDEDVDLFVVELGALLHDIADSKFHGGDETIGPKIARNFLMGQGVNETTIVHVENIIKHISFKGGNFETTFRSKELDVIQDADRLDAIGAIGIARCFNYGGYKNRILYDPEIQPVMNMSKEEYKRADSPTINHFYEKLLLLKDRMNPTAGRRLAASRHAYMETFLAQVYAEWDGER